MEPVPLGYVLLSDMSSGTPNFQAFLLLCFGDCGKAPSELPFGPWTMASA